MSMNSHAKRVFAVIIVLLATLALGTWYASRPAGWTDPLSPDERRWISERGTVRVGATPSSKPLEFFDARGEYRGMVADYLHLLEERLHMRFTVVESKNLKELLDKAQSREVDMIPAFAANPASIDYMVFTRPYLELPTVILVNKSQKRFLTLDTMQDMDLALPKQYAVIDFVRRHHPDLHIQPVYNYLAALLHVSFDEIDATIISLPQASYYIEDKGITNLRVAGHTDFKIFNRIAVRADDRMLAQIIQKGLDTITPADRDRIFRRWVTLDQNYVSFFLQNKRFWYFVGAGAALLLMLFTGVIAWNRSLRRRVHERTRDLERELNARMRLMTAIEQTEDGIFILDTNGNMEYANPSFLRMSGYALDELVGRHCAIIRSDRQDAAFYRELWDGLKKGEVWRGHSTYRRKDGTLYEVDVTVSPIVDQDGRVTNYVEVTRDVTEQLRMEAQLRQRQKMEELGTLAGGIAHDFNNIIAAILGYAELALLRAEPGTRPHTNLEHIRTVARRAREMVNQILIFSRRREPERRRVELAPAVEEVLELLRSTLPATIAIESEIGARGRAVLADPTQIHQIVMNLGTNAGYAMRQSGGTLTVRLGEAQTTPDGPAAGQSFLQLTVEDTGVGIPEDILDRIFDPFFTTKPQGKGTGMGLSIVHGMVGSMGGTISVRSTPGSGTVFTVLLPETTAAPEAENGETAQAIAGRGHVLVVDDEPDMVNVLSQMLGELGYEVTGTSDSLDALRLFSQSPERFALVITDQTMPRMTGDRLAQELNAIRPATPIIVSTGFPDQLRHLAKDQHGIRAVLPKPYDMGTLSEAVRDALGGTTA
ncbi:PAS domain S-box-containing protein [Desulfobaculum xiamenense]|uniref:histidine kinase n=1 Tax=Desulfobaculum xiamenense TaxID=995050 RepID=A0A846QPL2_9BACT|nr:transporter substrate-binding domain-containing protein [Desulfobaculum xiamenense]NJB69117.1 PAS domain S-box-containing protein [Desulfobaculum xiamenense]